MIIGLSGYIGSGKDTVGMLIQALTMMEGSRWRNEPLEYVKAYGGQPNVKGGWEIKKFAEKLKQIASMMTGIPREKFEDQEFKNTYLSEEWGAQAAVNMAHKDKIDFEKYKVTTDLPLGFKNAIRLMTVREFLQKLGTEAIRDGLHKNAWVNALFADYKYQHTSQAGPLECFPNWIITDVRFPNEAKAIKDRGGIVVRIERMKSADLKDGPGGTQLHPSETSLDDWKFDYIINNNGSLEQLLGATKTLLNNMEN